MLTETCRPSKPTYLSSSSFTFIRSENPQNRTDLKINLLDFLSNKKKNMVGIFSRFSGSRTSHRRSQSTQDEREAVPPNVEAVGSASFPATAATAHGIEIAVEFKPIEHPIEPPDNDLPVKCPLPEPSILNDVGIWKERFSANSHRRADLPVMKEGTRVESGNTRSKQRFAPPKRSILPSISAPEQNILKMLEEYKEATD